ncbi:MAG: formylglycine-generating enzyme family protein [Planctomycetota bacterium]|nr:formylglycine-generating enzyme family protein [Planctomycetota bacterium]
MLAGGESRAKDQIRRIHEYVWSRHIDGSDHYDHAVDEDESIRILDAHYSEIGNRNNPDQLYLGILLFERAFEHPDEQPDLFGRAKKILEFYRRMTGEEDWEPVEDRLADIYAFFGEDKAAESAAEAVAEAVEAAPEIIEEPVAPTEVEGPVEVEPQPEIAPEAEVPTAPESEPGAESVQGEEVAKRRKAAEAVVAGLEVVEGMQPVPAGTFLFGPGNTEVYLDTFFVDKEPVTNEEYLRFVRETGYRMPRYLEDPLRNAPKQPVVGVSFRDAMQYAKWAGKELPTESQWEKAGRGNDGRTFPWGNDPPGASDACFGLDPVTGGPSAVGKTLRNVSPYGVHDMCGNVWEWTTSPLAKSSEYLVVRGGSYNDPIEFLNMTFRQEAHPKDKCEVVGFRCVKNVHH